MTLTKLEIFRSRFFEPVDVAILVYFRIIFGAIMLWEVFRYFDHDFISRYWIDPSFLFTYYGFDWVKPLPGDGMYYLFVVLGILAVCIAIGFKYRIAATLFFLAFSYIFLLEQARYLNHFYLIILISFLMIFVPAHRSLSIDAWLNRKKQSDYVPAWSLWILRLQLGVVYFYGGIAKLNWDWVNGEPMRYWLNTRTDFPILGSYFTEEWMVYLFAYSAILVDLLVVPFLLWKRTRLIAFGIVTSFHVLNDQLFTIGIFPWFMIFATLMFFDPSWPRLKIWKRSKEPSSKYHSHITSLTKNQKVVLALVLIFVVFQLGVPLRHFALPGNVSWTEEGHNFSWHMKLRDKTYYVIEFYATDPESGQTWTIDPDDELKDRQINKMAKRPDMIHQYALHLADNFRNEGYEDIEIRVKALVSLNEREPQLLIDPEVDLASLSRTLLHKPWIMPLEE